MLETAGDKNSGVDLMTLRKERESNQWNNPYLQGRYISIISYEFTFSVKFAVQGSDAAYWKTSRMVWSIEDAWSTRGFLRTWGWVQQDLGYNDPLSSKPIFYRLPVLSFVVSGLGLLVRNHKGGWKQLLQTVTITLQIGASHPSTLHRVLQQ